jgi:hypothetical protein
MVPGINGARPHFVKINGARPHFVKKRTFPYRWNKWCQNKWCQAPFCKKEDITENVNKWCQNRINGARPHFVKKRTFPYRKWGLAPFIPKTSLSSPSERNHARSPSLTVF